MKISRRMLSAGLLTAPALLRHRVGLPAAGVSRVAPRRSRVQPVMISAAAAAALVIAGVAWWVWPAPRSPTAGARVAASAQLVAPRLSIVVLPFGNLSNDPDQQYFADGITEDMTTALSRITHMFVISRTTAFTFGTSRTMQSRSAASWAYAMCWKGVFDGQATGCASTPS